MELCDGIVAFNPPWSFILDPSPVGMNDQAAHAAVDGPPLLRPLGSVPPTWGLTILD